jgi:hypothetical protein
MGGPSWIGEDGDSTGKPNQLWKNIGLDSVNFVLDNKIQELGGTIQTDYEITEQYAANPAALVFEAQAVNLPEYVSPPSAQAECTLGPGKREASCIPDDEIHECPP